jgi:hypothetical protein
MIVIKNYYFIKDYIMENFIKYKMKYLSLKTKMTHDEEMKDQMDTISIRNVMDWDEYGSISDLISNEENKTFIDYVCSQILDIYPSETSTFTMESLDLYDESDIDMDMDMDIENNNAINNEPFIGTPAPKKRPVPQAPELLRKKPEEGHRLFTMDEEEAVNRSQSYVINRNKNGRSKRKPNHEAEQLELKAEPKQSKRVSKPSEHFNDYINSQSDDFVYLFEDDYKKIQEIISQGDTDEDYDDEDYDELRPNDLTQNSQKKSSSSSSSSSKKHTSHNSRKRGFAVEQWLADNMRCPYCGNKSLRTYDKRNMKTIDYVCISPEHKIGLYPIFFQVKASQKSDSINDVDDMIKNGVNPDKYKHGKYYANNPYFSYYDDDSIKQHFYKYGDNKFLDTIKTNKYETGKLSHEISVEDNINKKILLVAYICVLYDVFEDDECYIDLCNSFCVLPIAKQKILPLELEENDKNTITKNETPENLNDIKQYYKYIVKGSKIDKNNSIISFNRKLNDVKSLSKFLDLKDIKFSTTYDDDTRNFRNILNNPHRIFEIKKQE